MKPAKGATLRILAIAEDFSDSGEQKPYSAKSKENQSVNVRDSAFAPRADRTSGLEFH
jgi:hypothetical protein